MQTEGGLGRAVNIIPVMADVLGRTLNKATDRIGSSSTTGGMIGAVNNNNWNRQNCTLHQPLME